VPSQAQHGWLQWQQAQGLTAATGQGACRHAPLHARSMHSQRAYRKHSSSVQLWACAGLTQRPGEQAHGLIMARVCASAWLVAACSSQSSTFAASVSPERAHAIKEVILHIHQVCGRGSRAHSPSAAYHDPACEAWRGLGINCVRDAGVPCVCCPRVVERWCCSAHRDTAAHAVFTAYASSNMRTCPSSSAAE